MNDRESKKEPFISTVLKTVYDHESKMKKPFISTSSTLTSVVSVHISLSALASVVSVHVNCQRLLQFVSVHDQMC